jgi:cyclase
VSLDINERFKFYKKQPQIVADLLIEDEIKHLEDCDIGEFLITDVSREGSMSGPDVKLAKKITDVTTKPVIFAGGVAKPSDCFDLIKHGKVNAVGCSSIFHFTNFTPDDCRKELIKNDIPARAV